MKKLIMVVMAMAFVAAFASGAYAAESAQLGLQVTFAPNNPITMRTDPEGPFKIETGKELVFTVHAENATNLKCESPLPYGATFTVMYLRAVPIDGQGESTSAIGTFKWTPKNLIRSGSDTLILPLIEELTFYASNSSDEVARLVVEITVVPPQPVISIELNESAWKLDGVKLGELRSNYSYWDKPMHYITNTGNVPVFVDIGYGPQIYPATGEDVYPIRIVRPGLVQGLDTFTTAVGAEDLATGKGVIIPPSGRVKAANIAKGSSEGLSLTYGAPTQLSKGIISMGATYELRAYPASITVDPPIVITG